MASPLTAVPPPPPQKMNDLRARADKLDSENELLKAEIKKLEQDSLQKEQEITSLQHKHSIAESEIEKLEAGLKDAKDTAMAGAQHGTENENLVRKLAVLEEEAESADKSLRETNEKYVDWTPS